MGSPRPRRRGPRPARLVDGQLREDVFGGQVEALARFYGWRVYHTHRSDRSPAGFPDYVLVRGVELIFAEIKVDRGSPRVTVAQAAAREPWLAHRDVTDAQADWLRDLIVVADAVAEAGPLSGDGPRVDVYLWRPQDWDAIQARLARGRRRIPASFDPRT